MAEHYDPLSPATHKARTYCLLFSGAVIVTQAFHIIIEKINTPLLTFDVPPNLVLGVLVVISCYFAAALFLYLYDDITNFRIGGLPYIAYMKRHPQAYELVLVECISVAATQFFMRINPIAAKNVHNGRYVEEHVRSIVRDFYVSNADNIPGVHWEEKAEATLASQLARLISLQNLPGFQALNQTVGDDIYKAAKEAIHTTVLMKGSCSCAEYPLAKKLWLSLIRFYLFDCFMPFLLWFTGLYLALPFSGRYHLINWINALLGLIAP